MIPIETVDSNFDLGQIVHRISPSFKFLEPAGLMCISLSLSLLFKAIFVLCRREISNNDVS